MLIYVSKCVDVKTQTYRTILSMYCIVYMVGTSVSAPNNSWLRQYECEASSSIETMCRCACVHDKWVNVCVYYSIFTVLVVGWLSIVYKIQHWYHVNRKCSLPKMIWHFRIAEDWRYTRKKKEKKTTFMDRKQNKIDVSLNWDRIALFMKFYSFSNSNAIHWVKLCMKY